MSANVRPHEQWAAENPQRYVALLETLYAATGNPLFVWETMRVVGKFDAEPSVSSIRYFASVADSVIAASKTPRKMAEALGLGLKSASYGKQFEELKDPNAKTSALWFAELLLELAEDARKAGRKTEEDVIADLHAVLGYSKSKIKKLYLSVKNGKRLPLVISEPENLDAEWAYSLLREWMMDHGRTS